MLDETKIKEKKKKRSLAFSSKVNLSLLLHSVYWQILKDHTLQWRSHDFHLEKLIHHHPFTVFFPSIVIQLPQFIVWPFFSSPSLQKMQNKKEGKKQSNKSSTNIHLSCPLLCPKVWLSLSLNLFDVSPTPQSS